MAHDLVASRELAWRLFVRNTSARYRQTLLGYLWAILPPAAGTLLFLFLRRNGVFSVGETGVPYVVFLVTGLTLWQTFVDAVNAPLRLVSQSRSMLTKINFPREALILAGAAEVAFNFVVRLLLLAVVFVWSGFAPPVSALIAPLGLVALIALGMALGLALVPFSVLYQDVEQGLNVLLALAMFATPVLYPAPAAWPASLAMTANPIGPVLDTTRAWILGGAPASLAGFAWVAGGTLVVLAAAWVLYRLALPILIERMSA